MQLLEDRVLLRMNTPEAQTEGGIILPEASQQKQTIGTVVAFGPGRRLPSGDWITMTVNISDKVLLAKYAGTEVEINGEQLVVVRESDILLVL